MVWFRDCSLPPVYLLRGLGVGKRDGEGSLFSLLHVGHGKCCRPHPASGWLQPSLRAFAGCLRDGAVWGLGPVLEVAPPPPGNLLEGQPYLPLAPRGISQ